MSDLVDRFIHKYSRLPTETDPDYLEMLRMSKYRVLPGAPDVQPGKCANCGASKNDGRIYIDIGLHLDWYGAVIFCGECLKDIAKAAGLFEETNEQLLNLVTENSKLQDLKEKGADLHEKVVRVFKEFEEYYDDLSTLSMGNNSDIAPYVVPDETASESGTNKTKSGTTKSTASTGSKNIRSLAELLNDTRD